MPVILHKFINDLTAIEQQRSFGGERIAARSNVLVIGTFNPADEGVAGENIATWFYGRTNKNKFWRYFPTACTGESLHPRDGAVGHPTSWKDYCIENRIVIVDLIKSIDVPNQFITFKDREIDERIADGFENVDYFDAAAAFGGITFERVLYSLLFRDRIPKIKQIRNIINNSLMDVGCIQNQDQIKYCKTPSRGDAGPSWLSAFQ